MRQYVNCNNAHEAEAKIEIDNPTTGKTETTIFFGTFDDANDWVDSNCVLKNGRSVLSNGKKYWHYERPVLNWETGRLGDWMMMKANCG